MKTINSSKYMKNAFDYNSNPATFSRASVVETTSITKTMYVSGTASIGTNGETLHKNDFRKQLIQTFNNITSVLVEDGFTWKNVVRTTIYLKDIDENYEEFNKIRAEWFDEVGITNYPASTCIQARMCRPDLLCEIEAIAVK